MKRLALFVLALWILTACNKDKFKTEPQVKIISISPTYIARGNVFSIKGSYTDNEGDLDSLFLVYKWFNGNTPVRPPNSINPIDTLRYSFSALAVPDKTKEVEFEIRFEYQTSNLLPQGII
ncbi:MAG: hypothetical protein N2747_10445, partial [Chitinophagaceae bacterium]|nr:hypothetical protein [Chitinophagaceae bacterium]